jgi:hypothetical protein
LDGSFRGGKRDEKTGSERNSRPSTLGIVTVLQP